MMKQIMIPVAAFAVTVTGASAFNTDMLDKIDVDLSSTQIEALEAAHELRVSGADRAEVMEVLEDAGVDADTRQEIRAAAKEVRTETREAISEAVADQDYDAFVEAIEGTPLADAIDSEADFETFLEARELRQSGDREGAAELMAELGIEKPEGRGHGHRGGDRDGSERPDRGERGQRSAQD